MTIKHFEIKGRNIIGIVDVVMQIKPMRKPMKFMVYPMQSGKKDAFIYLQSDKRCAKICAVTGEGFLSASCNYPMFVHCSMGDATPFVLDIMHLNSLRGAIQKTSGVVGDPFVKCADTTAQYI